MPIVLPISWGIAILLAAGASVVTLQRYREEELELGRVELPEILRGDPDPEPEPQRRPPRTPRPTNTALREALDQMVRTQRRMKDRCDDQEEEDCPYCKPAVDGHPTSPWHIFEAGPVRKPSPRARGALYQHYVIPWFGFYAEERNDRLTVHIEEWEWKRGRSGSWDGLHHAQCKLMECKLGYRDFVDGRFLQPTALGDPMPAGQPHTSANAEKPWLPPLSDEWSGQIAEQHGAFDADWPVVSLEWTFSDDDVLYCFLLILRDMAIYNIGARHVPYELAPSGTNFVRELYASGEEDYGYWEDN